MKHKFLQFCSTVLALVMLLQTLPVAAHGAEDTTGDLQASSAQTAGEVCVVSELPQGRGEYQKEFLLSNGNRLAAVYAHAVHYEKDGQWPLQGEEMSWCHRTAKIPSRAALARDDCVGRGLDPAASTPLVGTTIPPLCMGGFF